MPELGKLIKELPPYQGKKDMVTRRQDTWDIIREVLQNHENCAADYDKICDQFWKGNAEKTAIEIFNFCKEHLHYKVEPTYVQTVKTPAAILWQRYEGNDCKHYASFIVGLCEALKRKGYPTHTIFRFASYDRNNRAPGHVFAVMIINGRELWIDPVLKTLNQRHPHYHYKLDKKPPMSLYKVSGINNHSTIGGTYEVGVSGGHWSDGMGKLHLKATDFLLPGSHEARLIHAKLKKHHLQPHATDFLIPGSGLWRRLREKRRKKHQAQVSGIGAVQADKELQDLRSEISGAYDDFVSGLPYYQFVGMGKAKKAKDPNKKHKGFFKKIAAGAKGVIKKAGQVTMKVSGAASRNSYLLLLKMNAFHLASNIMKKVKDPGQSAGEAKVLPKSAAWQKLAKTWEHLGGNPKVLWHDIVQGTRVWNKHHKNNAIHGITNMDYIGYIDYVGAIEMEAPEDNAIGNPIALAAVLAAAAPIIAGMRSVLKSFGIGTDHMKKGATDAEADLVDNHNEGVTDGDSSGQVDQGAGIKTSVENHPDGSQTVNVEATKDLGGGGPSSQPSTTNSGGGPAPEADDSAADSSGGDNLPAKSDGGGGGGITNFMATAGAFVKAHKTPIMITGGLIGVVLLYKLVIHPAAHDFKRRR